MTIRRRKGSIKRKRRDELHSQLPPDCSMERFRTKVTAKNSDANIPSDIPLISILQD